MPGTVTEIVLEVITSGFQCVESFVLNLPACPASGGEFTINGFRNRDLRGLLFADAGASPNQQRHDAAAVSRKPALLRAHGLIRKDAFRHRYPGFRSANDGQVRSAAA
jgi:hypothetical protein